MKFLSYCLPSVICDCELLSLRLLHGEIKKLGPRCAVVMKDLVDFLDNSLMVVIPCTFFDLLLTSDIFSSFIISFQKTTKILIFIT